MTTPALVPCPFCGGTASFDSSVGGVFVECDFCEARGPYIQVEEVGYPESMFTTVPIQKAKATAAAAWNQRSAWQSIETAPIDGTEILASDCDVIDIVSWHPAPGGAPGWSNREGEPMWPAWWQPLPDHPPLPVLDNRTPEEICGYGDDGLCDHGATPGD